MKTSTLTLDFFADEPAIDIKRGPTYLGRARYNRHGLQRAPRMKPHELEHLEQEVKRQLADIEKLLLI